VLDSNDSPIVSAFVVTVGSPANRVTVSSQTLTYSAVVTVESVELLEDGFLVIREDDAGSAGEAIGHTSVAAGSHTDVEVALERFAIDGERLYATLHVDDPADGDYDYDVDPSRDPPATDAGGDVVSEPFDLTVIEDPPDVRVTVSHTGNTAYRFVSVDQSEYEGDFSLNGSNPDINLREGLRYEFINNGYPTHPFQLIDQGRPDSRADDTVLLAQDTAGTFSGDSNARFVAAGRSFRVTITGTLVDELAGYRCGVADHLNMRGNISIISP
jgi:hypothetical protein